MCGAIELSGGHIMNDSPFKYVFGPVPSRRLGLSLGVDLVPFKTCTFDCIYCQLGCTTAKTTTREEFVPLADVVEEIERKLAAGAAPDYITLAGSGEPTLYARLGEFIAAVKSRTDVPIAVLTNGSLLGDPALQRELLRADLVVPSLDAADEETYRLVNRPHSDLRIDDLVNGLVAFRKVYSGPMWLEVVLLKGITGTDEHVGKLAGLIDRIQPDRIQLNTAVRPPAESSAEPVSPEDMARFKELLGERAEVVADFDYDKHERFKGTSPSDVLDMLRRRPCSLEDIAQGLGIHRNEAIKSIEHLLRSGEVAGESRGNTTYYCPKHDD